MDIILALRGIISLLPAAIDLFNKLEPLLGIRPGVTTETLDAVAQDVAGAHAKVADGHAHLTGLVTAYTPTP